MFLLCIVNRVSICVSVCGHIYVSLGAQGGQSCGTHYLGVGIAGGG